MACFSHPGPLVPFLLALAFAAAVLLITLLLVPFALVLRFRAGTTRRRARRWVIGLNLGATLFSSCVLLVTAAVSNVWIPNAFHYTLIGAASGFALGLVGLAMSRWEDTAYGLHYTPSRWLSLLLTLVVAARIGYGFWRAWMAWQTTPPGQSWIANAGAAGSMGAGAMVLGYFVVYWAGLHRKVRTYESRRFVSRG
jgi:hypothetical protein